MTFSFSFGVVSVKVLHVNGPQTNKPSLNASQEEGSWKVRKDTVYWVGQSMESVFELVFVIFS